MPVSYHQYCNKINRIMHSSSLQINRVSLGVIIMTSRSGGKSCGECPVTAASGLFPAKRATRHLEETLQMYLTV